MPDCTLAIETSTAQGSVAVWHGGAAVYERSFTSERSHNSQLFVPLGEALALCGAALQRIVVGLGPGSYTGVRNGIAAAQCLAWSRNVPLIGLPSVLAWDAPEYVLCGDARRGLFYTAEVKDGRLLDDIQQQDAEPLIARREADKGRSWYSFDDKVPLGLSNVGLVKPQAVMLAKLAALLSDETVFHLEEKPLEPIYLSAPFITQPKNKAGTAARLA